ncbi:putative RNA-directed DNA polymerase from transposon BS [Trichonephila inaurata madagascariensis]|uniref:Putative RNA-directed DNA polymerase from transposon BS n=1 Tax=Trichonephila inaurata madagascariensis TaxID=2747483 RepID=A0A8X6XXN9_9ARAC|nr:putative RNA-directed DNA polymerase from transposon BS [Trichonephila inaurata madagascariensis]
MLKDIISSEGIELQVEVDSCFLFVTSIFRDYQILAMTPLEYLGITVLSKNRTITIKNLYYPPNSQHLETNMMEGLFDDDTIILGDFNAKNTTWGSTITNARGLELSNLVNDKAFLCLNDGTHTFRSNNYGSTDVLSLTFISSGLFPYSSWRVLDNIGSDHLPILVGIDLKVNCTGVKNLHWNFKIADWGLFENISNILISQEPISDNLEKEGSHFKHSIFTAAKSSIPREKSNQTRTFFAHNSDIIKPFIVQRTELLKVIAQNGSLDKKIELNKLNAEIKKIYVHVKRSNWQNLCEKIDYRTSNTKLWKMTKQIDNLKPSNEETNAIISDNDYVSVEAREVAEALAQHYTNESRLAFSSSDKHLARVTRNQIKSCRDRPADNPLFNVDFTLPELSYTLQNLDTNKSPGPDSIPGHFLSHLGILGRPERLAHPRTEELAFWREGATETLSLVGAEWQHGVEEERKGGTRTS